MFGNLGKWDTFLLVWWCMHKTLVCGICFVFCDIPFIYHLTDGNCEFLQ